MDKRSLPKINLITEEKKNFLGARKVRKQKAGILDPRRGSRIAIDAVTAVVVDKLKTSRDLEMISNALNKHFIFTSLSGDNRSTVISHMRLYQMNPGEIVFEQGRPGSVFFVVASGKLEILVNAKRVNIIGTGDSFGELALLHDSPRSASVKTLDKVSMWGLDRKLFRSAVETVNAENYKENKNFINSVPLFTVLTPMQRDSLVGSFSTLKFRSGDFIVKEGDPGDLFYIIKDGMVSCLQNGNVVREMSKGSFFGEQALLYNTVRTATVVAKTDVKCVAISRNKLNVALGNHLQHIIYQNSKVIAFEKSQALAQLTKKQQSKVLERMQVKEYQDGNIVVNAGTMKNFKLIFLLKGKLRCLKHGVEVFQALGDEDILSNGNDIYPEDYFAIGDSHVAEIEKFDFDDCVGGSGQMQKIDFDAISALRGIHILRHLSSENFQALIRILKLQSYEDDEIIVRQNTPGDRFFMIKTGKVNIVQDGIVLRTVGKNDYFGERSVIFNDNRTASVIANGPVCCWVITKSDFSSILEESVRNILIKRIELQDDAIGLHELSVVKLLGKGNFGNVYLVINKSTRRLYALKTISRKKIDRYNIQENLILERKILLNLDHIFILKLIKTFKDSSRVYFLTEYVRGLDLFDVLRDLNLVSDRDSKFYTSCLVLILEYLHERDIIYRDLKPENIMIDDEGYPKLIDFGISKILNGRTYTIVGTPHYMAPEVIVGKGYSFSADYWSLGIILYEFLCCSVPFGEEDEDPYIIYEKVLKRKLVYPGFVDIQTSAKSMIEQLLNKNPVLRNGGSAEILKTHKWFSGVNWDSLINRQFTPPYVPQLPDLDKDIQTALRTSTLLEEVLSVEELHEEKNDPGARRQKNVMSDWDQDF
ncbi:hypothetical protein SteCoe_11795 [Stentor coeruleus]|uniref:cGMP-dependent protein kinase n=1 Tax=Stentor coeruleus TaxID=5963 RepID=A0A1R2CCD0_9CILI|nr:hypothetical protein SteCoe_11795 [Stentor coeruleus]